MSFKIKYHINKILLFLLLFLLSCQLQEPQKNHGILFLENRSKQLMVGKTNKNDVLKLIGYPHTKSVDNEDTWLFIERSLSKGKYHHTREVHILQ